MSKKILFTLFSFFLIYRSFELIKQINYSSPNELGWTTILVISFILNLFITGIFAFLGFAFLTNKILPNSYYKIKNPKKLVSIYKIMRVDYFKFLLLKFFWGKDKNRKKYFDGTKTGIDNFDTQTRQSEFGHLSAFIIIQIVSFGILIKGHIAIFGLTTIINLIGNVYPIILQRTHRIQIERLKIILNKRKLNFENTIS